ncbi:MAG: tRNA (N(6)-L-threonylcarbamoyladenosine(37)-C(2))-methylthiotransferase MtaB [Bacteroidales bacterium]|nr:tRNA (N(6)-L-threonylcarbamoyladenosine(37)-C(2))-methylthiotransferase MtaB [Bacteroidales bacterium]
MKKIAFKTLGCRLNLFETDALVSQFSKKEYQVVDFEEEADVYVVNTCTVTNQSDHKSKQVMNHVNRLHPGSLRIVTGCMATNYKQDLEKSDKVDFVVDNDHKSSITSLVDAYFNGEVVTPDSFAKDLFGYQAADETFHTRSLIKIQDGCDNFCTFCIIPKVRGRATSRSKEDILENIRQVVEFGYKEVVLTGVNIGRYQDGETDFEKLVEEILNIPGDFRVRISSIEPDGYSESFFRLFENPKLAPHMHICLQSGSEDILLKMRRMYTAKAFVELGENIRKRYPDFNLTTDVIVGFPGETEEDLQETLDVSKRVSFGHIHTFKYSVRRGTRAERMPEQIPDKEKTRRSEQVRQLSDDMKRKYRSSLIGKEQTVLVEQFDEEGFATGYGEHYVPVIIRKKGLQRNEFYKVKLTELILKDEPVLIGEILNS